MKEYYVSAMVVYYDTIYAESEEDAKNKFCRSCPYDVDGNTIEVEESDDEEKDGE